MPGIRVAQVIRLAPGFFGTPLGALPVGRTYQSYGIMCIEVSQAVCNAAWNPQP